MADNSDMNINIRADSSNVQSVANAAKDAVKSLSSSARTDAASMSEAFRNLNATLQETAAQTKRTADAASDLKAYAELAGAIALAGAAYQAIKTAIVDTEAGLAASKVALTEAAVGFGAYAQSVSYASEMGLTFRDTNETLAGQTVGAVARAVNVIGEWVDKLVGLQAANNKTLFATAAVNGALDQLNDSAKASGFTNLRSALSGLVVDLEQIPGVSEQAATSIESGFIAVQGMTVPLNQALVELTATFANSGDDAKTWAQTISKALNDPEGAGKSYLNSMKDVDKALKDQLDDANAAKDVSAAQAAILQAQVTRAQALTNGYRQSFDQLKQNAAAWGLIGSAVFAVQDIYRNIFGSDTEHSAQLKLMAEQTDVLADRVTHVTRAMNEMDLATEKAAADVKAMLDGASSSSKLEDSLKQISELQIAIGRGDMSDEDEQKALQIMRQKGDEAIRYRNAVEGSSAVERGQADVLEKQLQFGASAVEQAQLRATAAQRQLLQDQGASGSEATLFKDRQRVAETELALRRESLKVSEAEADLRIQKANGNPQAEASARIAKANLTLKGDPQSNTPAAQPGSAEAINAQKEILAAQQAADKDAQRSSAEREEEDYAGKMKGLDRQKVILQEEQQASQISKQEMFAGEIQIENQRAALETEHYSKLKTIWGQGNSEYSAANQKLLAVDAETKLKQEEITKQANEAMRQDYAKLATSIGGSVSSSFLGMIQGTSNFSKLAKAVTLDIIKYFIDAGVKIAENWAITQALNVSKTVAGEQAMTAATLTGVAQRTAATTAGAGAQTAATSGDILHSITASAAETFAGVFGFLSPVLGPAAAGPAAASQATVMATAGAVAYDVGAWDIPHDQLAVVHKGETIMTPSQGEAFRSTMNMVQRNGGADSSATGSGGDTHAHFHVSAIDAAGVKSFFRNNSGPLARALNQAVKNGDHLGLKNLGG